MAIDPNLSLRVQVPAIGASVSSGLATGEKIGTSSVRKRLLEQQAAAGELTLEQSKQQQAMQGMQNFADTIDGLANVPLADRAKVLAQRVPMLKAAGIPVESITSMDLTDAGIKNTQASMKPFMSKLQNQASVPAAIQTFDYHQRVLNNPEASDDQKRASRIALKLEGGAKTFTPKVVDIGGSKFLQVGQEFFNPNTLDPVATNEQGLPVAGGAQVEMTPEVQREMQAEQAAAITSATEGAKIDAKEGTREAEEMQAKKLAQGKQAITVIDDIFKSDRLDNITGLTGMIPFSTGKTQDLLGQVQQLKSITTADNLGIMTGVLSETDMKIIAGLSNDITMTTDADGNVTGISGSYEGTKKKLKKIRDGIVSGMNRNGHYVEGQVITNPSTGERLTYRNGAWVK